MEVKRVRNDFGILTGETLLARFLFIAFYIFQHHMLYNKRMGHYQSSVITLDVLNIFFDLSNGASGSVESMSELFSGLISHAFLFFTQKMCRN